MSTANPQSADGVQTSPSDPDPLWYRNQDYYIQTGESVYIKERVERVKECIIVSPTHLVVVSTDSSNEAVAFT